MSRELLVAVASGWDKHVDIIDKIIPQTWKVGYLFLILFLSIRSFQHSWSYSYVYKFGSLCPYSVQYVASPFFTTLNKWIIALVHAKCCMAIQGYFLFSLLTLLGHLFSMMQWIWRLRWFHCGIIHALFTLYVFASSLYLIFLHS